MKVFGNYNSGKKISKIIPLAFNHVCTFFALYCKPYLNLFKLDVQAYFQQFYRIDW